MAAQWPPSGRPVAAPVAAQWPPTNNGVSYQIRIKNKKHVCCVSFFNQDINKTILFVGGHWAATGAATGRPLGGHYAATVRWQLTPSEYQRNTNGSIPLLKGGANCRNVQGRVGRCQCWGAARSNLPKVHSHIQTRTYFFSVHFIKLPKCSHPLPLITTRIKQTTSLSFASRSTLGGFFSIFICPHNKDYAYHYHVCTFNVTFRSP